MKFKIVPNVIAVILAVIIGAALFKQIDFQHMTVEKPFIGLSLPHRLSDFHRIRDQEDNYQIKIT